MEEIIKKAIEGGYIGAESWIGKNDPDTGNYFMDPLFFQALGKACGWFLNEFKEYENDNYTWGMWERNHWKTHALQFHEINLTQGFDKAVEYLESII